MPQPPAESQTSVRPSVRIQPQIRASRQNTMTAEEVSDYLRLPLATVHHLTRMGRLKNIQGLSPAVYEKVSIDTYAEQLMNVLVEKRTGSADKRANGRRRCFIQADAVVTIGSDVWMGHGSILDISESGIQFEFHNGFIPETLESHSGTISLRVTLDPLTQKEVDLEGDILRMDLFPKTRFAVSFGRPQPGLSALLS